MSRRAIPTPVLPLGSRNSASFRRQTCKESWTWEPHRNVISAFQCSMPATCQLSCAMIVVLSLETSSFPSCHVHVPFENDFMMQAETGTWWSKMTTTDASLRHDSKTPSSPPRSSTRKVTQSLIQNSIQIAFPDWGRGDTGSTRWRPC